MSEAQKIRYMRGTERGDWRFGKKFYSDMVAHMIRYYLTTPEGLDVTPENRPSPFDVGSWISVQSVWHTMSDADRVLLTEWATADGYKPMLAVQKVVGTDPEQVRMAWERIQHYTWLIAKQRGFIGRK